MVTSKQQNSAGHKDRDSMTSQTQGWEAQTLQAGAAPMPARVDLADYRRRKYETSKAEMRWRYENGYPFG